MTVVVWGGVFEFEERKERERDIFFSRKTKTQTSKKSLSSLFCGFFTKAHTHRRVPLPTTTTLRRGSAHTRTRTRTRARVTRRENGRDNGPTLAPGDGQSPVLLQSHLQLQRVRLGDRDRLPGGVLPFRNVGRGEDDDERGVLEKTDRGDRDDLWGDVWGVFGHGE